MAIQLNEDEETALKAKIREAFSVFDREGRNACDVREVGTIIRSLNIFPTEKQLQLWIIQIEEEEPTGFIVYDKVRGVEANRKPSFAVCVWGALLILCTTDQFEALAVRLLTEEATSHKRNTEDEILAAFQVHTCKPACCPCGQPWLFTMLTCACLHSLFCLTACRF